jgi:pimeloyl-ACP methyl ester carboxylesterase
MATFVLVHGAWSGAHGFRHVRRELGAAGHAVFTPSLTGIGERAHLTGPQVDLTTHVRDVVNLVLYEDLDAIVLVGFSYGGCVVTGSLEHIAERVRHLVYLDAFVPGDGESLASLAGLPAAGRIGIGDDWLVPPLPRAYDDAAEAEFMSSRRVGHPVGCFTEPVRLARPLEEYPFERTYIRAVGDAPGAPSAAVFDAAAAHARDSSAWHAREIATGHMVASNRPRELAEILGECAR